MDSRNRFDAAYGLASSGDRRPFCSTSPAHIDLIDIVSFARVVESGSISDAAERLGVAKSIVSRRVSRLEATLGAKLLNRTPRGTTVTEIGREYHARSEIGLMELEFAQEAVRKSTNEVSGLLRIQVQTGFGEAVIAPLLADFARLHPRIQFDVRFEDREVDMSTEAYDVAIWPGPASDPTLIMSKIAKIRWVIVGSPAYFEERGRPVRPADLTGHDVLLHTLDRGIWRLKGAADWESVRMNSTFRADNVHMLISAVRANLGLALLPMCLVGKLLESGEMETVLTSHANEWPDLHIFMPPARSGIGRVRALVAFLREKLRREI